MIIDLYNKFLDSTGVCTDTRVIESGNIFFALKGDNFNGNQFAEMALEKGASYAVVDDPSFLGKDKIIVVENVLKTLQDLGKYHRRHLDIPILAITGSNGKTTTKELISLVLSQKYRVIATQGNLNNHIGVPLTLLSMTGKTEIGVVEMGANHIGEISNLCIISDPTHGLITNIGKAHTEGFGGFEGVIRAKSELYQYLIDHNRIIFVNSNNPVLLNMARNRIKNPVYYPNKGDFLHCELIQADPYISFKTENNIVETRLIGAYNFENIASALCVGKYFTVDEDECNKVISEYQPGNNRSQVIKSGSNTIILDAYNANPSSMELVLGVLKNMKGEWKIAILGDMYELGDQSEEEHARIGELTKNCDLDEVFLCGTRMSMAYKANPEAKYFPDKSMLENYLKDRIFKNSILLVKGSRAMGLETILEKIK